MKNDFLKLHDAVLANIQFDWNERVVSCVLALVSDTGGKALLRFSGVKNLVVPAEWSWGQSSSINEFHTVPSTEGFVFSVEMQSGDTIDVFAQEVAMSTTVKELLRVWSMRLDRQESGIKTPTDSFRDSTKRLVTQLSSLTPEEKIDVVVVRNEPIHARFIRVSSGEVLAEILE